MSESSVLNKTFRIIMQRMVKTGQAPLYIVSAFETVEGREVMDSSRLSWLQGGSKVMEREEPGCGKQEPGMTRLTTRHGSWCIAPSR